jgi:hypothetical protein
MGGGLLAQSPGAGGDLHQHLQIRSAAQADRGISETGGTDGAFERRI